MSENVSQKNLAKYHQVIESLPATFVRTIKDNFIDMHGWPKNIKPYLTFDKNGLPNDFIFVQGNYTFKKEPHGVSRSNIYGLSAPAL